MLSITKTFFGIYIMLSPWCTASATTCLELQQIAKAMGIDVSKVISRAIREKHFVDKAKSLLNSNIAGGFYEIGAGSATYELFTKAGGSSRIAIESAANYSKSSSDAEYEPVIIDGARVYVHRDRVQNMLNTRYQEIKKLNFEASNEAHLAEARKFVFADTVGIAKGRSGRGWVGLKYESSDGKVTDLVMYVQVKGDLERQRAVLGELGVNVVSSIANETNVATKLVEKITDNLTKNDIEIDFVESSRVFDNLELNLQLLRSGLSQGVAFYTDGNIGSASIFDYQQSRNAAEAKPVSNVSIREIKSTQHLKKLQKESQSQNRILVVRQ